MRMCLGKAEEARFRVGSVKKGEMGSSSKGRSRERTRMEARSGRLFQVKRARILPSYGPSFIMDPAERE